MREGLKTNATRTNVTSSHREKKTGRIDRQTTQSRKKESPQLHLGKSSHLSSLALKAICIKPLHFVRDSGGNDKQPEVTQRILKEEACNLKIQ